jgi:hypothetical protein
MATVITVTVLCSGEGRSRPTRRKATPSGCRSGGVPPQNCGFRGIRFLDCRAATALVTMCIAGDQGTAAIFERM